MESEPYVIGNRFLLCRRTRGDLHTALFPFWSGISPVLPKIQSRSGCSVAMNLSNKGSFVMPMNIFRSML